MELLLNKIVLLDMLIILNKDILNFQRNWIILMKVDIQVYVGEIFLF